MMMKREKMEGRLGAGGTVLAKNKKENGRKSQKSAALKQERGGGGRSVRWKCFCLRNDFLNDWRLSRPRIFSFIAIQCQLSSQAL